MSCAQHTPRTVTTTRVHASASVQLTRGPRVHASVSVQLLRPRTPAHTDDIRQCASPQL
jgi:hypothetical protein